MDWISNPTAPRLEPASTRLLWQAPTPSSKTILLPGSTPTSTETPVPSADPSHSAPIRTPANKHFFSITAASVDASEQMHPPSAYTAPISRELLSVLKASG